MIDLQPSATPAKACAGETHRQSTRWVCWVP